MCIARVIVIQPALVHFELHIRFVLRFSVDYEHLFLTIISDPILLYDVSQIDDVGDGSLAEPNICVVTRHFCLVVHYHGTTIALESRYAAGLECLCDQFLAAEKTHCVLTVQTYDLPEVQLIVEIWRLVEDFGDVWLKCLVQLCELESPVCNLKVQIFFLIIVVGKFGV